MIKRTVDVSLAMMGIVLFSPGFLLLAWLVFCEDRGPIFFRQKRLGKNRQYFTVIKFRTMRNGRITRIGRYLRLIGLDEIPQLANVLAGQMSVVGPRPLMEEDVNRLGWNSRTYDTRWSISPGVTGLAQIYAGKGKKLSWFFDQYYVVHRSLLLDVKIIFISFCMNLIGKYRIRRWLYNRRKQGKYNWSRWLNLFAQRSARGVAEIECKHQYQNLPSSLAKSLAIFQLGESGGGTVIEQVKRSKIKEANKTYAKAMEYFVAEEHRHAAILAQCVNALGGTLVQKNWTDGLFVFGRRLLGLRLKILVLLAAEVVGICYYRLIASRLPFSKLEKCLHDIVNDEQSHLVFHCEFLRSQIKSRWAKTLFSLTWFGVTGLAMIVVYIDHRQAMRDLNLPARLVFARWIQHVLMANELVVARKPRYTRLSLIDRQYI